MKKLALDLGDKWIGSAISDGLGITCRPYETIEIENLDTFLQKTLHKELIDTIIIGIPLTMRGTQSEQTKKTIAKKEQIEEKFQSIDGRTITWILWDERLSTKRATAIMGKRKKEDKQKDHNLAAAFILQSYLDSKALL